MNGRKIVGIFFVFLFLQACTGLVISDVSVFHVKPFPGLPQRYAFLPLEGQKGSLEYESYKGLIRDELQSYRFTETSSADAEILVAFYYGIDAGKEKIVFATENGQTADTAATPGKQGATAGTTTDTSGNGSSKDQKAPLPEYKRQLHFNMLDKKAYDNGETKKLYEARVVSTGTSGRITEVMPSLIKALFKDFPGKSGETRRVVMPLNPRR